MPDYGRAHRALRRALLRGYIPGVTHRCVRCGEIIAERDTSKIHLDHDDATGLHAGLAHAVCNLSAGGVKRAQMPVPMPRNPRRSPLPKVRQSRIW